MADQHVERGPTPDRGSSLDVMYSKRKINCYGITDIEIAQLGAANVLGTVFFSLGSALIGVALDFTKDMLNGASAPPNDIYSGLRSFCYVFGIAFWLVGFGTHWFRSRRINEIKRHAEPLSIAPE